MVEVSKEDFRAYCVVQVSGVTNMMNTILVAQLGMIPEEVVWKIISKYKQCVWKHGKLIEDPDVLDEGQEMWNRHGQLG